MISDQGELQYFDLSYYDEFLLAQCSHDFRTVARVVAETGVAFDSNNPPHHVVLVMRIRRLVLTGVLQFKGDMQPGRPFLFSEVKLRGAI